MMGGTYFIRKERRNT